jgi:hypothetical protein
VVGDVTSLLHLLWIYYSFCLILDNSSLSA